MYPSRGSKQLARTSCGNPEQLKSFFDGVFELSAHLVVANLVKKKDAIPVNLPREKIRS
jgi:hypothetical protein